MTRQRSLLEQDLRYSWLAVVSGVLNNDFQKLPNNEYYQNFSYSLKSQVPYVNLNDPGSDDTHLIPKVW